MGLRRKNVKLISVYVMNVGNVRFFRIYIYYKMVIYFIFALGFGFGEKF